MKNSVHPCHIQTVFCDIMSGTQYLEIDPMSFVPFPKIRDPSQSEMLHFVPIFTKQGASSLGPVAGCITFGTNKAIAVHMKEKDLHHAASHFCRRVSLIRLPTQTVAARPHGTALSMETFGMMQFYI